MLTHELRELKAFLQRLNAFQEGMGPGWRLGTERCCEDSTDKGDPRGQVQGRTRDRSLETISAGHYAGRQNKGGCTCPLGCWYLSIKRQGWGQAESHTTWVLFVRSNLRMPILLSTGYAPGPFTLTGDRVLSRAAGMAAESACQEVCTVSMGIDMCSPLSRPTPGVSRFPGMFSVAPPTTS